jgi:O-antigen ligase
VLGFLLLNRTVSKFSNIILLFVGFMTILVTKNKNQEAVLWSAYIVGSEVLFRMSKGLIFYEFPKYMVFIFLLTGLIVEKKKQNISPIYLIYILLLLFGITFSDIPYPESIRTNIIFNLSGPILLGLCAIYFYKRKISIELLLKILKYMSLPIISMASYIYLKVPNLESIVFGGVSSTLASGGYGPNQVATILGVGVFILSLYIIISKKYSGFFIIDVFLLIFLFFRALITLSRGGVITAILAILLFSFIYLLSKKNNFIHMTKYFSFLIILSIPIWLYTSSVTDGMVDNRYTNKNAKGVLKKDISAGRIDIFKTEWNGFIENPFFGIGVGTGKFVRGEELGLRSASHNEMSRLLGEHGALGLIMIFILFFVPIVTMNKQTLRSRAFLSAFLLFWFLTVNHSAMRLAMPAFIYGLAVITIVNKKEIIIVKSVSE